MSDVVHMPHGDESLLLRRESRHEIMVFDASINRIFMRIKPTDAGFDIEIPDGVTMTEAAEQFIETVRAILKGKS